jgi:hypothetical protein
MYYLPVSERADSNTGITSRNSEQINTRVLPSVFVNDVSEIHQLSQLSVRQSMSYSERLQYSAISRIGHQERYARDRARGRAEGCPSEP